MSRKAALGVGIAVVALIAVNWLLLAQNRQLRTELSGAEHRLKRKSEVQPGERLSGLRGRTRFGAELNIDYREGHRPTLVVVFSPRCGFCAENWPLWQRFASNPGLRWVAVDLSSSADEAYLAAEGLSHLPLMFAVKPESLLEHRFSLVPQTLLVAPDGTVLGVWTGPLAPGDVSRLESLVAAHARA